MNVIADGIMVFLRLQNSEIFHQLCDLSHACDVAACVESVVENKYSSRVDERLAIKIKTLKISGPRKHRYCLNTASAAI